MTTLPWWKHPLPNVAEDRREILLCLGMIAIHGSENPARLNEPAKQTNHALKIDHHHYNKISFLKKYGIVKLLYAIESCSVFSRSASPARIFLVFVIAGLVPSRAPIRGKVFPQLGRFVIVPVMRDMIFSSCSIFPQTERREMILGNGCDVAGNV